MKKNLVFKLGLFCAALVLVATCFVTNAWAKYTTTVTATDTARVAKWAVTFENNDVAITEDTQIDIFTTSMTNIYKDGSDKNTLGSQKLIAPGSQGSFVLEFNSSSQVAVQYTCTLTENSTAINVGGVEYKIPILWSATVTKADGTTETYDDKSTLAECFADATSFKLDATNGTEVKTLKVEISWEWAFEIDDAQNVIDTYLGENTPTYTISLQVEATQVQPA